MSLKKNKSNTSVKRISAGDEYRAAFERLKNNKPERLPKGTTISQNNVAKEAGSDPSALKKARFPTLIAEIQKYVQEHAEQRPPSVYKVRSLARKQNRSLREKIMETIQQRDHLSSLLNEADATILELYARIDELEQLLKKSNILLLDSQKHRKLMPDN